MAICMYTFLHIMILFFVNKKFCQYCFPADVATTAPPPHGQGSIHMFFVMRCLVVASCVMFPVTGKTVHLYKFIYYIEK